MIFILLVLLGIFPHIHSKFITYTLYQTNDLCQYNWQGSICLPIFSFNQTNQVLLVQLEMNKPNQCPTQTLVYIRSRQCIYCSKNLQDIHCNQQRIKRMAPIRKEHIYRNHIAVLTVSVLGIFIIGSLFTLFVLKRSKAHTNLLESYNLPENRNTKSLNHIKVPTSIKSTPLNQLPSTRFTVPNKAHSIK